MSDARAQLLDLKQLATDLPAAHGGTDNDLVRDFIAGDESAFTRLVTKYKDALTNYLNMIVGDYDVATDLCQETFFRVYKNITRYSNLYQFSTWIYRIATNLAIDEMRYRRRRGQVFYNNVWAAASGREEDAPEFEISDRRLGPGDEMLRRESGQVLGDAIRSLPEKYRTAFILKEVQELQYEEVARVLGCSAGTIKSRLHRARELLQRKLERYL
jgi:RNA polymerase sigma-70 factor (ECF subfamily)